MNLFRRDGFAARFHRLEACADIVLRRGSIRAGHGTVPVAAFCAGDGAGTRSLAAVAGAGCVVAVAGNVARGETRVLCHGELSVDSTAGSQARGSAK